MSHVYPCISNNRFILLFLIFPFLYIMYWFLTMEYEEWSLLYHPFTHHFRSLIPNMIIWYIHFCINMTIQILFMAEAHHLYFLFLCNCSFSLELIINSNFGLFYFLGPCLNYKTILMTNLSILYFIGNKPLSWPPAPGYTGYSSNQLHSCHPFTALLCWILFSWSHGCTLFFHFLVCMEHIPFYSGLVRK